MVGNGACANLRTVAVPLGGCAKGCVSFFVARCARGGCKGSETELALIYVCSLSEVEISIEKCSEVGWGFNLIGG